MKRLCSPFCCVCFVWLACVATAQNGADSLRQDIENARKSVYPALVNIAVITRFYQAGRAQRAPSGGSGVIVSKDGYVLTNYHVAGNTTHISCTLPDGETLEASVVTHDILTDLSVLKLNLEKRKDTTPLPFAKLGDSDALKVGDYVLAMGNPMMLASSMTLGIVSNTKRVFTDFNGTEMEDVQLDGGEKTGLFTRWIQHDALILPGNSGGPLVNLKGEVIGINELGGNGMGFAIPSNIASYILNQALNGGVIKRGWLGLTVLPVKKIQKEDGALVASVWPDSPAAKAKLVPGDILLSIDDTPVNVRFFEEAPLFYQMVALLPVGKTVTLKYLHAGKTQSAQAVIAPMEKQEGEEDEDRTVGVTLQEITTPFAREEELPDKEGVYVTGVRPSYPFNNAVPPIVAGDVILAVGGTKTSDLKSFHKAIAAQTQESFVVTLRRDDEQILSVVKIVPEKADPDSKELPKAWLGIKTQVMSPEVAQAMKLPGVKGFRVTQVYPYTEAAKAGLKSGDVITMINKDKLTAYRQQDSEDLKQLIEDLPIGEKETLTLVRDGKPLTLTVVTEKAPDATDLAKKAKQKEFEFAVRGIMPIDRMEHQWTINQKGVIVTETTMGGWAAVSGLEVDDVILSINGVRVDDVPSFDAAIKTLFQQKPPIVQIFVKRGPITHFIFIEPEWAKISEDQ